MPPIPDTQSYMPAGQVLRRYGRKNLVWLWRLLRNDETFPRPLVIAGQRYWLIADLVAWEQSKRKAA